MANKTCYICSQETSKSKNLFNDAILEICSSCENKLVSVGQKMQSFEHRSSKRDLGITRRHSDANIHRNLIEILRRLDDNENIIDYLLGLTFSGINPLQQLGFYSGMVILTDKRLFLFIPKPKGIAGQVIGCSFEYSSSLDNIIEIIIKRHLTSHNFTIRDKGGLFKPTKDLKIIEDDSEIQRFITSFDKQKTHNNISPNLNVQNIIQSDNLDKIKKLKELFDMGVITEDEFNSKKQNLLDNL
jgi:hypothetical protein